MAETTRFTDRARQILVLAQAEAGSLGADQDRARQQVVQLLHGPWA